MTGADNGPLVFDTGPLSHFSESQWLGVLKAVAGDRPVIIPDVVQDEIAKSVNEYPHLRAVLDADWIQVRPLGSAAELAAFATYAQRLVVGDRNQGECGVLATAQHLPGEAVLDDFAGSTVAKENGIKVTGTLGLLCQSIRAGLLTVDLVSALADDLLLTEYYMPFKAGEFRRWALEDGALDYSDM